MLEARRFVVVGRVQGVGFRFFARDAALAEGVHGWVSNRMDGSVELFAEGDREALTRLERRLRRGPPAARVEDVRTSVEPPAGYAAGFDIRA